MAIDVKSHKKKVLDQKPSINLVPFIDILFTIMIFLVVTSNIQLLMLQLMQPMLLMQLLVNQTLLMFLEILNIM